MTVQRGILAGISSNFGTLTANYI